jgi:hypothetical protein
MRENKYFEEFGKPFPASDVSWRLQYVNEQRMQGIAVPYLDARAVADRLDEVVGQNRWKDSYTPWHESVSGKKTKSSQLCTISIYDDELGQWIDKTDGAEDSDIEAVKGGLSDAFKRAAVKWNIGRYLYSFNTVWVAAEARGNSYVIPESENAKLEKAYNDTVARMFGTPAPKQTTTQPIQKQNTQPQPVQQKQAETPPPAPAITQPQNTDETADVYEVRKINVQNNQSSMLLFGKGKQFQAFMQGADERLKVGTRIKNVNAGRGQNSYGTYAILNSYDIAA